MRITVELSSWFKKYTGGQMSIELEVEKGVTAANAILAAGIPIEEAGLIMLGNAKIDLDFILPDRSCIKIFPYIIGG